MKINILIALLFLVLQCRSDGHKVKIQEVHESIYGKNLVYPDSLVLVSANGSTSFFEKKLLDENLKIVSLISAECWKCIDEIKRWEEFCYQYQSYNKAQFYFIFNNVEIEYFKKVQLLELPNKSNFSYLLDINNNFLPSNKLPESKMFHTFLLNNLNEVEILGSPFLNDKLKNIYINYQLN